MIYVNLLRLFLAVIDVLPGGVLVRAKNHIIQVLVLAMESTAIEPVLRRRAGLALDRLGWVPHNLDELVEISEGKFLYGNDKHEIEMPYKYWIGKYPVTNLQYARFIEDGGYKNKQYWGEEGWRWLQRQDPGYQPSYFSHNELGSSIFPVVTINWYEANAYCQWLNVKNRQSGRCLFRLPSEQEWERAARGADGRKYPWGDEFDSGRANTEDSDLNSYGILTTSVRTYTSGVSPTRAWDMSGNVWEWTNSWYDQNETLRVLRGGSWDYLGSFAHCSFRNFFSPEVGNYFGFRIALSLEKAV